MKRFITAIAAFAMRSGGRGDFQSEMCLVPWGGWRG